MAAPEKTNTPFAGCFCRLIWMLVGIVALLFLGIEIVRRPGFSGVDAAAGAVVAGMILARFVDVRYLNGQTADGKPATMADWRRYSVRLAALALVLWGLLHAIAAYL